MRHLRLLSPSLVALALAAACSGDSPTAPSSSRTPRLNVSGAAASGPVAFCNPARITINQANAATPYPSLVTASGIPSGPIRVTATLNGVSHATLADVDILLVGPGGQNVLLLSDAGGSANLVNATFTFDDNAAAQIPGGPHHAGSERNVQADERRGGRFLSGRAGSFRRIVRGLRRHRSEWNLAALHLGRRHLRRRIDRQRVVRQHHGAGLGPGRERRRPVHGRRRISAHLRWDGIDRCRQRHRVVRLEFR